MKALKPHTVLLPSLIAMAALLLGGCQQTATMVVRVDPAVQMRNLNCVMVELDGHKDSLLIKNIGQYVKNELEARGWNVVISANAPGGAQRIDAVAVWGFERVTVDNYTPLTSTAYAFGNKKRAYATAVTSGGDHYNTYNYELFVRLIPRDTFAREGNQGSPAWEGSIVLNRSRSSVLDAYCQPLIRTLFSEFPAPTGGLVQRPLHTEPKPATGGGNPAMTLRQ